MVEIKNVEEVTVAPSTTPHRVNVTIPYLEGRDLLPLASIEEAIDYFSIPKLLECIGMEEIQSYINSKK